MKILIYSFLCFVFGLSSGFSETPDMLARKIISPKIVKGVYVPGIGTPKDKQDIYRVIVDSSRIFREYIMSDKITERIRISYALTLLSTSIEHASDEESIRKLKEEQLILGARLSELQKSAEQDAAANP